VSGSQNAGARGAVRGRHGERAQVRLLEMSPRLGPPRASTRVERTAEVLAGGTRDSAKGVEMTKIAKATTST
jgi:hypothetical protein